MSSNKGIIKKLKLHELVGYSSDDNIDVYPITSIAAVYDENNKSLADILKDIQANGGGGSNPKSRLLQIYKTANIQPSTPIGGTYDFENNTFTPPTGWVADSNGLTNPIWMSMGSVLSNNEGIVWSVPICIAGATETTTLKRCYVAIIYKNSDTQPETPSGGSCDFSSGSPIFSPPDGWSINSEIPVNESTWCSIRAFYSDNTETQWSVPSKVAQANVNLTAAQLDVIAGKITITANNLDYIASHVTLNTESLDYIAKNMTFTADQIRMIANNVDVLGTLNTRDLTINGDKSKFNADGSGYIAGGNITWSTDGSGSLAGGHITWDKNGNATYSGGLKATTGTIAGFKISGDGITNEGFDNDAYIIIRNDNEKSFTGIGANVMPAFTGRLRCNARFENDKVDNDITARHNLAMYLHASGSAKGNWALYGVGNAGLEGAFMGYGSNEFTPSEKNNIISLKDGNQVLISVSNNYTNVHLPLHTIVAEDLFINNNTKFSLRLTIINTSDSQITVYGYKGTTNATDDVPHLWNGNTEVGSIGLATHQTLEVMLVYNGTSYCAYALGGKY